MATPTAPARPATPALDLDALGSRRGATTVGPYSVRWREDGPTSGPAVLLLHGIYAGASGFEWRRLAPLLTESGARVRTPDLLGYGESDRPDVEWDADLLGWAIDALTRATTDELGPVIVVASSLTAAHAIRAVAGGAEVAGLVLVTPTGLGSAQTSPSGAFGRAAYALGRHTPIGDAFVWALSSEPSVRWFLGHQTYADPAVVTDAETAETRRIARLPNAKHIQLAFVANRLGVEVDAGQVRAVAPTVIWGTGQGFMSDDSARWADLGAQVTVVGAGLPHVESPDVVADAVEAIAVRR